MLIQFDEKADLNLNTPSEKSNILIVWPDYGCPKWLSYRVKIVFHVNSPKWSRPTTGTKLELNEIKLDQLV